MALIDDVRAVLERLAPEGWRELLLHHGLDITAANLEQELLRELPGIDRRVAGFEDFASEGSRGIEPGQPAHSLLYHALASPNVLVGVGGEPLDAFPTLREIEAVENYVFGVEPPSVADLVARFPHAAIAVAVFATEYRPGTETVHRRHADLCFSRTGVARVGTAEPLYDAKARGFVPFVDGDRHAFRVLPARYAPYVAVLLKGEESLFGPMDFRVLGTPGGPDSDRDFWVPLHKLFAGNECVRGLDLSIALETGHANEKLRRIHLHLQEAHGTGRDEEDIGRPPFFFTEGIARFSTDPEFGEGVLCPVTHERLVEPAVYEGEPLSFEVPPNPRHNLGPSMLIPSEEDGSRRAPEFVHVRHHIDPGGAVRDLNDEADVVGRVREGGYEARHYVDFTGDGWVKSVCPELGVQLPRTIPAYSTVTAPDFYPGCEQRELIEWWNTHVPSALRGEIWSVPPLPLSDERLAPNLQLEGSGFRPEDKTVTAIVSLPMADLRSRRPLNVSAEIRHTHLPDGAAGVFAPGWDTSKDKTGGVEHLAAYGLGSPFPEDAKLCAALSAFWPAVAPDVARSFSQARRTVTPMTDEEIGSVGDLPWDGVPGPRLAPGPGGEVFEYASFDHVDYVNSALDGRFSLALTGRVHLAEYAARILAIARAYAAFRTLGIGSLEEEGWRIVSFRHARFEEEDLQQAATETGTDLGGVWYFMALVRHDGAPEPRDDHRKVRLRVLETMKVFSGALPRVLIKQEDGVWRAVPTS